MSGLIQLPPLLPAITLWPEWAWAIAYLDKRIENRPWAAQREHWGSFIAIHAGAHIGGRPGKVAQHEGLEALVESAFECGWIVEANREKTERYADGSVALHACRFGVAAELDVGPIVRRAIVAVAELVECSWDLPARGWGIGPCQWRLGQVYTLSRPIGGVSGAQGMWIVPRHVRDEIQSQLAEAA